MSVFRRKKASKIKTEIDVIGNHLEESDSDSSATTKSIKEAESKLNEAINLTEKRAGSLLVFQQATKDNVVELGRQVSSLSADHGFIDDDGNESVASSLKSEPLFVKAERCDASILKQLSWEVMSDAEKAKKNKKRTSSPAKQSPQRSPPRKWDKLRNEVLQENGEEKNQRKLKVFKPKLFRRRPPKGKKGKGNLRNSSATSHNNLVSSKATGSDDGQLLAGDSLEVVAYNSSDGRLDVLPPFPSKMI